MSILSPGAHSPSSRLSAADAPGHRYVYPTQDRQLFRAGVYYLQIPRRQERSAAALSAILVRSTDVQPEDILNVWVEHFAELVDHEVVADGVSFEEARRVVRERSTSEAKSYYHQRLRSNYCIVYAEPRGNMPAESAYALLGLLERCKLVGFSVEKGSAKRAILAATLLLATILGLICIPAAPDEPPLPAREQQPPEQNVQGPAVHVTKTEITSSPPTSPPPRTTPSQQPRSTAPQNNKGAAGSQTNSPPKKQKGRDAAGKSKLPDTERSKSVPDNGGSKFDRPELTNRE